MLTDKAIKAFLSPSYGFGYGNGDGFGDGYGDGYGFGYGDGYGDGDGNGNGYGAFVKITEHRIYWIDGTPTVIYTIHGSYARGGVPQADMTLKPCYIARVGDSFAHGDTLREAQADAQAKEMRNLPVGERVTQFLATYPDSDKPIPAKELFSWHNILTGSCLFGRKRFCAERGIDVERDSYTVRDFVELTKDSYGGEVIKMIAQRIN